MIQIVKKKKILQICNLIFFTYMRLCLLALSNVLALVKVTLC